MFLVFVSVIALLHMLALRLAHPLPGQPLKKACHVQTMF